MNKHGQTFQVGRAIRIARKSLTLVSVGPVTTCPPIAAKKEWASLRASAASGVDADGAGAGERFRPDERARDLRRAVDAIRVAGDGVDVRRAVQRKRQRKRVLRVRATDTVAAPRDRQLAARQDHERTLCGQRPRGVVAGDLPRLALRSHRRESRRNSPAPAPMVAAASSDCAGAATMTFSTRASRGSSGRIGFAAGLEEGSDRRRRRHAPMVQRGERGVPRRPYGPRSDRLRYRPDHRPARRRSEARASGPDGRRRPAVRP